MADSNDVRGVDSEQSPKACDCRRVAAIASFITAVGILTGVFVREPLVTSDLSIVASEQLDGEEPKNGDEGKRTWKVTGHASTSRGESVPEAEVTLVAITSRGELRNYSRKKTDKDGNFTFEGVSRESINAATGPVHELKVTAFLRTPGWYESNKRGQYQWTVGSFDNGNLRAKEIGFSFWFLPPLMCFLISISLVSWFSLARTIGRWYHFPLCVMAILATGSMVAIIGYSIMWINEHIQQEKAASLGFLNFYRGTFVKDGTTDWLVSLTSPAALPSAQPPMIPSAAGESPIPASTTVPVSTSNARPLAAGFGAPLWVVFVAVLGSGLLTVVLVIGQSLEPLPTGDTPEDRLAVRIRFRSILEHQFFVLFSPLGAIVVYQLMLAGGAAGSAVVVAITTLGAGATLNGLLLRAVKYAAGWIEKGDEGRPLTSKSTTKPAEYSEGGVG